MQQRKIKREKNDIYSKKNRKLKKKTEYIIDVVGFW